MNKKIKNKKMLSTCDELLESLNAKEKAKYQKGYKKLLLSEMRLALKQNDKAAARELAKAAGVSLTNFSNLTKKN